MSDAELEAQPYPKAQFVPSVKRAVVDFDWVHREVRRPGVTLQLSWSEYVQAAQRSRAEPCQYSQFCARYIAWRSKLDLVMRQVHRAGEKGFIDYSGKKPKIYDAATGQEREVELFVVTLGAIHICRGDADAEGRLHRLDHARIGVLRRRAGSARARSAPQRG